MDQDVAQRSVILLAVALLVAFHGTPTLRGEGGLTVVVTFQFILGDVEGLLCSGDRVYSLIPPGVDPHEYQLSPRDVETLAKANLIISTAHTPFEMRIKEMVLEGELKAKLIEIPSIPGVVLLTNPSTGENNLHGVLFHGDNYAKFVANVSSVLAMLRPECAEVYRSRGEALAHRVAGRSRDKPLKGLKAVISEPTLQYLVAWLGADVVATLRIEHHVPITPSDIARVEEALKSYGSAAVLIAVEGGPEVELLNEMASRYRVPIIVLPDPVTSTTSVANYLDSVLDRVSNTVTRTTAVPGGEGVNTYIVAIGAATAVIVFLVLALHRMRR